MEGTAVHDRPRAPAAAPLSGGDRRSRVSGWAIAATAAVVAILLYAIRYALLPFIIAAVVGFIVQPLLDWSARRLGRRWPMVIVLYVLMLAGLVIGGYWVGRLAVRDLSRAAQRLPQMIHEGATAILGPHGIDLFGTTIAPDTISHMLQSSTAGFANAGQLTHVAMIGGALLAASVLTLVMIPYFMVSGPRLAQGAIWLLPPERRGSVREALPHITPLLRRYMLGVLAVVAYTALIAWIGFGPIFHLRGAILLAIVVGVLEIIPAVGPVSSMVLVGLTAVQQGSLLDAGLLMVFALLLRLSIDNIVGPLVLGRSVRVHPVVVMFSFVCGAMLFGVIGLLLAVPVASCIKIVLNHYYSEPIAPGGDAEPTAVQIVPQSSAPPSSTGRSGDSR